MPSTPKKHRKSYTDEEIRLILEANYYSTSAKHLGDALDRTASAINWVRHTAGRIIEGDPKLPKDKFTDQVRRTLLDKYKNLK